MIMHDRGIFYEMPGTFCTEDVIDKFPLLRNDASEAGKCFALGCYTACVFHLMRMMEHIVQKWGSEFEIKGLDKKTWGQVLHDVKNSPKLKIDKQDTRDIRFQKQWYLSCHDLLAQTCRAIRNPAMHSRIDEINRFYSENEAKDFMDLFKWFLQTFIRSGCKTS
jgi:hypothetical protein